MSTSDDFSLDEFFGEPSGLQVQEAAWLWRRKHGDWPLWVELREALAGWLDETEEEADARILEAVRRGEVLPKVRGIPEWGIALDEATDDRLTRRKLALGIYKREEEEA